MCTKKQIKNRIGRKIRAIFHLTHEYLKQYMPSYSQTPATSLISCNTYITVLPKQNKNIIFIFHILKAIGGFHKCESHVMEWPNSTRLHI